MLRIKHVSFKADTFEVTLINVLMDGNWQSFLSHLYKLLDIAKY